jgi:two-component system, NtrC family, response regulator AtoC
MAGWRSVALRPKTETSDPLDAIIGGSEAMRAVKSRIRKVARSPASTVLLRGESGTGKNLLARALHLRSRRAQGPFLNITCSALPDSLLESELFGHERGAFTDAKQQRKGLLQQADGGTAFLDEIGDISPAMQVKLLRFLEERVFRRVGGSHDIHVEARIVAATHCDLEAAVAAGAFREDLYYRLSVLPVKLPPLRERRGDIALLVRYFVGNLNREFEKNVTAISPAALARLEAYHWPGNVRELRNVVERAMLLVEGSTLEAGDLELLPARGRAAPILELPAEGVDLAALERDLVAQALAAASGNKTQAARLLHLSRDQLRYRVEKFDLAS